MRGLARPARGWKRGSKALTKGNGDIYRGVLDTKAGLVYGNGFGFTRDYACLLSLSLFHWWTLRDV